MSDHRLVTEARSGRQLTVGATPGEARADARKKASETASLTSEALEERASYEAELRRKELAVIELVERMTKYDGGPAFPASIGVGPSGDVYWSWDNGGEGMSIRDYFAGQAVAANVTYALANNLPLSDVAGQCYLLADAMLAARNQGDEA